MGGSLAGTRVMLTRPANASDELAQLLRAAGATITSLPLIAIDPPHDLAKLQAAVDAADRADWIVFTSVNGVESFARLRQAPLEAHVRVAAVGRTTAQAVDRLIGRAAALTPSTFAARQLAEALATQAAAGTRVALFAARGASPELRKRLMDAGLEVSSIEAYATREAPPPDLVQRLAEVDVVVLTSGSGARALTAGLARARSRSAIKDKAIVCIGEMTASEARRLGLTVAATAVTATAAGVFDAIAALRRPRP
jgi:uroporphyrinogen-III synthase